MRTVSITHDKVNGEYGVPVKYNGEVVGKAYIHPNDITVVLDKNEREIKSMLCGTQQSMSIEIARNNI